LKELFLFAFVGIKNVVQVPKVAAVGCFMLLNAKSFRNKIGPF